MKCLDDCHEYELESLFGGCSQRLSFVKKVPVQGGKVGELSTVYDGVTNEEVLRVLIHRISSLQFVLPCEENAIALENLEHAYKMFEKRNADRVARGVQGKQVA